VGFYYLSTACTVTIYLYSVYCQIGDLRTNPDEELVNKTSR